MKLFLDDIRNAPDDTWIVVRDPAEFLTLAGSAGSTDILSLDHDLGDGVITGYDVMKRLEADLARQAIWRDGIPHIYIHSQNPVGVENMKRCLEAMKRIAASNATEDIQ